MYEGAAQYDLPPTYPVSVICNAIDRANTTENGILGKVFAGVIAYNTNSACYVNPPTAISQSSLGWGWQVQHSTSSLGIKTHWVSIIWADLDNAFRSQGWIVPCPS